MTTTATATTATTASTTATAPERVGSAARFAHRAMAIVNATMVGNAARNERSLAVARAFMALAFNARLAIISSPGASRTG